MKNFAILLVLSIITPISHSQTLKEWTIGEIAPNETNYYGNEVYKTYSLDITVGGLKGVIEVRLFSYKTKNLIPIDPKKTYFVQSINKEYGVPIVAHIIFRPNIFYDIPSFAKNVESYYSLKFSKEYNRKLVISGEQITPAFTGYSAIHDGSRFYNSWATFNIYSIKLHHICEKTNQLEYQNKKRMNQNDF